MGSDPSPAPQKLWETGWVFCGSVSLDIKQISDSASFTDRLCSEMRTDVSGRCLGCGKHTPRSLAAEGPGDGSGDGLWVHK